MRIDFHNFAGELADILQTINRVQEQIHRALNLALKGSEIEQAGLETLTVKGAINQICKDIKDDGADIWYDIDTTTAFYCAEYHDEFLKWLNANPSEGWTPELQKFIPREKIRMGCVERVKPTQDKK